jgi:rfaE bifunctional protein kinase chain/domain
MNIDIKKVSNLFKSKHIVVVGDVMLDKYLEGNVSRISPEAPVPIVDIKKIFSHAGGAANVARNINGLGGQTTLVGVVGDDPNGRNLKEILKKDSHINQELIIDESRDTTTKTRIISDDQQLLRLDHEVNAPISSKIIEKIQSKFNNISLPIDGIIIQDYDKGLFSEGLISWIMSHALKEMIPVYVDPKKNFYPSLKGARFFKPNEKEFNQLAGDYDDFSEASKKIISDHKFEVLLVTKGNRGLSLFENDNQTDISAIIKQVHDVSGAGDTVISTFSLCDSIGLNLKDSAYISNVAASIVCGIPGVAPITKSLLIDNAGKYFD